jgi:nucleoside-diphosphate-sugar epimerase
MKKVLVTGKNSYVGKSLKKWLGKQSDRYSVDSVSLRDDLWKDMDFSEYDVVFHVAGIAHVSSDPDMEAMYYKVNRDLTIEVAEKSKKEGVKQFIYMSSIIVYGNASREKMLITRQTIPKPSDFYGNSKLQAEYGLSPLESENFRIAIIRPPMIYGKGSKGNYPRISKLAQKVPFFPDIENKRSMLHIDNLCEFLRLLIEYEDNGLFFPQNAEYVKTSEMVKEIAEVHGKKIRLIRGLRPFVKVLSYKVGIMNKVFGDMVYEKGMSAYKEDYIVKDFHESIKSTESGM